jgi:hypothetical protein
MLSRGNFRQILDLNIISIIWAQKWFQMTKYDLKSIICRQKLQFPYNFHLHPSSYERSVFF